LLSGLRDHEQVPADLRVAQPQTWRSKVIKTAALVVTTTRLVLIQFAGGWPFWPLLSAVSRRALTVIT